MLGRPENSEAAPYYFTYIDQVTGDNPLATMEKQLPGALEFFAGITEKSSLHRYAPDKWNIREVLNHVTDTERAFAFRALGLREGSSRLSQATTRTSARKAPRPIEFRGSITSR